MPFISSKVQVEELFHAYYVIDFKSIFYINIYS